MRRLRSTSAVLTYVERVVRDGLHVPLGREADRYAAMRAADEASSLVEPGSAPFLAHHVDFDELGADLFHSVLDQVWYDDGPVPWLEADDYRAIVEFLDAVAPSLQAIIGRWFLRKRAELAAGLLSTASGLIQLGGRDRLVNACTEMIHWERWEHWLAHFTALTSLRHTHALESGAPDDTITLGVGALVEDRRGVSGVSYSFVLLNGREAKVSIPSAVRHDLESIYGVHDHRAASTRRVTEAAVANTALEGGDDSTE